MRWLFVELDFALAVSRNVTATGDDVRNLLPGADRRRRPHRYHLDALELLDDGKKEALQAEYLVSNLGSVPQIGNAPSCF